jgi:hypothetical protein
MGTRRSRYLVDKVPVKELCSFQNLKKLDVIENVVASVMK